MEVGRRDILKPCPLWRRWCKASIWVGMLVLQNLLTDGEIHRPCLLYRCILRDVGRTGRRKLRRRRSLALTRRRCSAIYFPTTRLRMWGLSCLSLSEEALKLLELKKLILEPRPAITKGKQCGA